MPRNRGRKKTSSKSTTHYSTVSRPKKNSNMAGKIALGATGVAVAAGVVAAGAALADKKNRDSLVKGASKALGMMQDMATTTTDEMKDQYHMVEQRIRSPRKKKSTKRR